MAKAKTVFVCTDCGQDSVKWLGKCPSCGKWGTLKEMNLGKTTGSHSMGVIAQTAPVSIQSIETPLISRIETGYKELDRVLGGGIIQGMVALIGGDPGIGKSTLMLQVTGNLAKLGRKVLYVTGEESLQQIKMRADRLNAAEADFQILAETDLNIITEWLEKEPPEIVIVDSIQTIFVPEVESAPGSVSQLRESTSRLVQLAKKKQIPLFLVGHVTKEGSIAGPKVIEHMVDTVLYFEGDRYYHYRLLRTVKNRFGSTNEIGIFEMKENGLAEVANPSEFFLNTGSENQSGTAVTATMEGSRPFLIEIQALVSATNFGNPQRNCSGLDNRRLNKIVAVLEKRIGLHLGMQDIFINVTGGGKLDDPAADLAIAAALFSSFRNLKFPHNNLFIGEIGLGGEVRNVSGLELRIQEAEKLGFTAAFVPATAKGLEHKYKIELIKVKTVMAMLEYLVG